MPGSRAGGGCNRGAWFDETRPDTKLPEGLAEMKAAGRVPVDVEPTLAIFARVLDEFLQRHLFGCAM